MKKTTTYSSDPQTLDELISDLQKVRSSTGRDVRVERMTFVSEKYQGSLGPYYKTALAVSVEDS